MNRRVAIAIGVGLVVLGLISLAYVGYLLFGGKAGDTQATSFFYLQELPLDDTAPEHAVVVVAKLTPPSGNTAEWRCGVRAWEWGDGQVTRDDVCTAFFTETTLEYPADHQYEAAGSYTVKAYIQNEKQEIYQSDELKIEVK